MKTTTTQKTTAFILSLMLCTAPVTILAMNNQSLTFDLQDEQGTYKTVCILSDVAQQSTTIKNMLKNADSTPGSFVLPPHAACSLLKYDLDIKAIIEATTDQERTRLNGILYEKINTLNATELFDLANSADYLEISLLLEPAIRILEQRLQQPHTNAQLLNTVDQLNPNLQNIIAHNLAQHALNYMQAQNITLGKTLTGHHIVYSVAFSPDGTKLASGSDEKTIKLWDVNTGQPLHALTGHLNSVKSIAFSPDGTKLASGSEDDTIKLWDVNTGQPLHTLTEHPNSVKSIAFSPDGTKLASGYADKTIKLWNAAAGKPLHTLTGHIYSVNCVAFSHDGTTLTSGSGDRTIKLWNAATGQLLNTLTGHHCWVNSVTFSPDGTKLASGSFDKTIKLWNAPTGKLLNTLTGHLNSVRSIAFSPNSKQLASGSADKTIKLWDVNTGKLLNTLTRHNNWVNCVAFSPDGKQLASGSDDTTIKLWDIPSLANLQLTIKQAELLNRAYQSNNHFIIICNKCNKDNQTYQTFNMQTKNLAQPLITTQLNCARCQENY